MATKIEEHRRDIIQNLNAFVSKKLSAKQAKLVHAFIEQYYANVSLEDLMSRDIPDLFGATLSQWNLLYRRVPGECKVHVYNPNFEQNGWQSTHTVIEIAIDDMPFLVDSLRMAILGTGLNIHFTIHTGGIKLKRNDQHEVIEILPMKSPLVEGVTLEAPLYFEIDRETDPENLLQLHDKLVKVLGDVQACNTDWNEMRQRMLKTINDLKKNPPPL